MDPRIFAASSTAYNNAPFRSNGGAAASAVLASKQYKMKRRATNFGFILIGFLDQSRPARGLPGQDRHYAQHRDDRHHAPKNLQPHPSSYSTAAAHGLFEGPSNCRRSMALYQLRRSSLIFG